MIYAHARAKNDMEYLRFIPTRKWLNTNYFELNFNLKLKTKLPKANFSLCEFRSMLILLESHGHCPK